MPLRPVSELGLVDLTDLASQEANATATRHPPTRPRRPPSQTTRRGAKKDPRLEETADQTTRGPASARGGRPAGGRSSKSSGGSARKRPGPPREMTGDSLRTPAALPNAQPHDGNQGSPAAKIGISVVTGAMGIAAGLLLSRAARRR